MKTQIQRKIQIERQTQIHEDRETLYWTVYGAKYARAAKKARSRRRRGRKDNLWGQFENIKVKLLVTGEDFDMHIFTKHILNVLIYSKTLI